MLDAAGTELSCIASERQALDYHSYVKRLMHSVGDDPDPYFLNNFTHVSGDINRTNQFPQQAPAADDLYRQAVDAIAAHADVSTRLNGAFSRKDLMTINSNAIDRATQERHPERLVAINKALEGLQSVPEAPANKRFGISVIKYARAHDLTVEQAAVLSHTLLPAIEANDEQVKILQQDGNNWGMYDGDFGIGDFVVETYASNFEPKRLNSLQMILRDMPASEMYRFEQNRKDALRLVSQFGGLRDFIHDQRPLVHDVVSAMVDFYESGDPVPLKAVLARTDYLKSGSSHDSILDRSRYDVEAPAKRGDDQSPVIDILRRLKENTEPISENPPESGEHAELLQRMREALATRETTRFADALGAFTESIEKNAMAGTEGVGPDLVRAIAWVSRASFRKLQELTYEDQQGLGRQAWFKSLLKLQELVASAQPYDSEKTEHFLESVAGAGNPGEMALTVMRRTVERISGLAETYEKNGKPDWKDSLWSGNVDHELMGLVDARSAQTAYGKRHRAEMAVPVSQKKTGD